LKSFELAGSFIMSALRLSRRRNPQPGSFDGRDARKHQATQRLKIFDRVGSAMVLKAASHPSGTLLGDIESRIF
jgi:hypothetical protein